MCQEASLAKWLSIASNAATRGHFVTTPAACCAMGHICQTW